MSKALWSLRAKRCDDRMLVAERTRAAPPLPLTPPVTCASAEPCVLALRLPIAACECGIARPSGRQVVVYDDDDCAKSLHMCI